MSLLNKNYEFDVIRGWPETGAIESTFPNQVVDGEQVDIKEGQPVVLTSSINVTIVDDEAARDALTPAEGDVVVQSDEAAHFFHFTGGAWVETNDLSLIKNTAFVRPAAIGDIGGPVLVPVNATEDYDGEFTKRSTLLFSGYIFKSDRVTGAETINAEVIFDGTNFKQRAAENADYRTQGFVEQPVGEGVNPTVIIP